MSAETGITISSWGSPTHGFQPCALNQAKLRIFDMRKAMPIAPAKYAA